MHAAVATLEMPKLDTAPKHKTDSTKKRGTPLNLYRLDKVPLRTHILNSDFLRSALMTLGFTVRDVGAWLFAFWACVEYLNLTLQLEDFMKATFKRGMDALAVLWA